MALLPPMLQQLLGYDVIDTGLVLMPRGIGVLMSMQVAGMLMRRAFDEARWRYLLSRKEFESWERKVARDDLTLLIARA